MRGSSTKTTDIRAGTYANTALTLTSADSGETWSQYVPDGYGTAVLDGGATSATTGNNIFTNIGADNLTINGFTLQNFKLWAVATHGGATADNPWPGGPNVSGLTVTNNFINTGYGSITYGFDASPMGAISQDGEVTNSTYANNVIENIYGPCIAVAPSPSSYTFTGLAISNNVCLNSNIHNGDSGGFYMVDRASLSSNITIRNNFIRDYQGTAPGGPARDVGIYLDEGSEFVTVTGNIIANTHNVIVSDGSNQGTMAFFTNSGRYLTITGNIVDLGTSAHSVVGASLAVYSNTYPAMAGNTIAGNIFIGNWSGSQDSYGLGMGPYGFPAGGASPPPAPGLTHNLYHNYGSGSLSTTGNAFSDTAPVTGNPMLSGTTYTLSASSPAHNSPVNFPDITGGWGPPGYTIPATGTAPSYSF